MDKYPWGSPSFKASLVSLRFVVPSNFNVYLFPLNQDFSAQSTSLNLGLGTLELDGICPIWVSKVSNENQFHVSAEDSTYKVPT